MKIETLAACFKDEFHIYNFYNNFKKIWDNKVNICMVQLIYQYMYMYMHLTVYVFIFYKNLMDSYHGYMHIYRYMR